MDALLNLILKVHEMYLVRIKFLLVAATLVFSACAESTPTEPTIPENATTRQQMIITGEIYPNSTRVNASGFEDDDKVGVFVSTSSSLSTTAANNQINNAVFNYDVASKHLEAPAGGEIYWETDDAKLSVFAYYPYDSNITAANATSYSFTVKSDQTTSANFYASDFITAKVTEVAKTSSPVSLTFNHSLSRINVTIKRGTGFSDDEWGKTKSFKISGIAIDGNVNLSSGAVATDGTAGEVTFMPETGDDTAYSAIVVPQNGQEEVKFQFTLKGASGEDDENYYYEPTTVTFEAGKQYNYTFKINATTPSEMTLQIVDIAPWGEPTTISEITMTGGE